MFRVCCSLTAAALLWAAPAQAQDDDRPMNAIGVGIGETTGYGLIFQRELAEGWRGRLNAGIIPMGGPYPFSFTAAGGGVMRDIGMLAGGRFYALGTGLYKQVAPNVVHLSVTPALGVQWGPFFLESGITSFSTNRSDPGSNRQHVTWGYALALGLGLVWEF